MSSSAVGEAAAAVQAQEDAVEGRASPSISWLSDFHIVAENSLSKPSSKPIAKPPGR